MPRTADITYNATGEGGTPVICLHGIGGNAESFRPQLEDLGKDCRTIAWNMPGYGGSKILAETGFPNLAATLAAFIDALNTAKAHIIGQSIGGMIAQEFALTYPQKVASLVLIATTPSFGGRDDTFKNEFLAARLKPLTDGLTMADLARQFVPQIVGPIASDKAIQSAIASMAAVPADSYRAAIECLVTFNRRADMGAISTRTCLIAGSRDSNAPARTMARMAESIPNAEFHVIEGAGHLVNLEAPDQTNAILRQFLRIGKEAQ